MSSLVELHKPIVITDGGPWADHDHACSVCQERPSVLNLNTGRFQPCWQCQTAGWQLVHRKRFTKFRGLTE